MGNVKRLIMLCIVLISTTVWAEENSTIRDNDSDTPSFETLDVNRDNLISHEEAYKNEAVIKNWDKLDTNIDGNLDTAEYSKMKPIVQRVENQKTDHPQAVEQYENGKYISPKKQIERNIKEGQ